MIDDTPNANSASPSPPGPRPPGTAITWGDVLAITLLVALLWLVVALFVVVFGPTLGLETSLALEGLTYAALLCLVPGWLVFVAIDVYRVASSSLAKVGIAMSVRLAFVLGGFLAVRALRPELGMAEFTSWLLLLYLATLALETHQASRRLAGETKTET